MKRIPVEHAPLDGVSVAIEGDIDLRGFFAAAPGVRPGFRAIRGTVTLDSRAGEVEIARLKAHVDAHCPVLDLLANATPVALELRPALVTATNGPPDGALLP